MPGGRTLAVSNSNAIGCSLGILGSVYACELRIEYTMKLLLMKAQLHPALCPETTIQSPTDKNGNTFPGIVNLFVGTKAIAVLKRGKTLESNEGLEERSGYAACFTPVTSFQVWNRPCKRARYSFARKRCLRGWKCPAMGAISREKALCVFCRFEPSHFLLP